MQIAYIRKRIFQWLFDLNNSTVVECLMMACTHTQIINTTKWTIKVVEKAAIRSGFFIYTFPFAMRSCHRICMALFYWKIVNDRVKEVECTWIKKSIVLENVEWATAVAEARAYSFKFSLCSVEWLFRSIWRVYVCLCTAILFKAVGLCTFAVSLFCVFVFYFFPLIAFLLLLHPSLLRCIFPLVGNFICSSSTFELSIEYTVHTLKYRQSTHNQRCLYCQF